VHPQPLIHAVVQQTMILVAHLATAGGVRTPLARVANQVFADLAEELSAQGVTKSVIADMFGMALSTYHRRARAASESKTDAGRTVWEAVLAFVREKQPCSGAVILGRFSRDDGAVVASVLKDLADSGMVYRSGRGKDAVYRVASPSDFAGTEDGGRSTAVRHILWLTIVRRGPIGLSELAEETQEPLESCRELVEGLVSLGFVESRRKGTSTVYESTRLDVPVGTSEGWEAAVLDHFQAVVSAICVKLRLGTSRSSEGDAVGGSTYTLDVWPGHPFEAEARSTLSRLRALVSELRSRIDDHNQTHERPAESGDREVTVYVGQFVKTNDADPDGGESDA
jgi:predicted transcriptional regulator